MQCTLLAQPCSLDDLNKFNDTAKKWVERWNTSLMTRRRRRCATSFALTRHGGLDVVGLFDSYFIVFHALRLMSVILVDVMTYSHLLFFSSVILSIRLFPNSIVPSLKGLFKYVFLYASYSLVDSLVNRERNLFEILLVCVF